jgi:signal transduction histidine kinase
MKSLAAQKIVKQAAFNPALPYCFFGKAGELTYANARMKELLRQKARGRSETLSAEGLAEVWPFFNEEKAAPALLLQALGDKIPAKEGRFSLVAEAFLKTYRLHVVEVKERFFSGRLLVAELVRSGDLMNDKAARQALFRTLSHEIRTSVMALKGYVDMVDKDPEAAKVVVKGMQNSLRRLDSVVKRLEDFKAELQVLEHGQD